MVIYILPISGLVSVIGLGLWVGFIDEFNQKLLISRIYVVENSKDIKIFTNDFSSEKKFLSVYNRMDVEKRESFINKSLENINSVDDVKLTFNKLNDEIFSLKSFDLNFNDWLKYKEKNPFLLNFSLYEYINYLTNISKLNFSKNANDVGFGIGLGFFIPSTLSCIGLIIYFIHSKKEDIFNNRSTFVD